MEYDPFSPEAHGFKQRNYSCASVGPLFKNVKEVFDTNILKVGKPKDVLKGIGVGALTGTGFVPKGLQDKIGTGIGSIKHGQGMEGFTQVFAPVLGKGARPAAVNTYLQTKGQQKYDPNAEVNKSLFSRVDAPAVALPEAPVPDAPVSMRSRAVTEAERAARASAGRRKGYMSTLFAKETGGFGGTGSGASLLGG